MKIEKEVLGVLNKSTVNEEDFILFLPNIQLNRNLYVSVNKCLESIGGKWNRKAKGHVFDHNPSDDLDEMINTGEWTDKKKEYQFFATPKEIVEKMILLSDICSDEVLLEPSAGDGAILSSFPKENPYISVELMPENCAKLIDAGYSVHEGDFLGMELNADKIIMNPPFSKQQDIKHVFHAWKNLSCGGRLVSIVSESPFFRENSLSKEFREWLNEYGYSIELGSGKFSESGTMVKTRVIVVDKPEQGGKIK